MRKTLLHKNVQTYKITKNNKISQPNVDFCSQKQRVLSQIVFLFDVSHFLLH